MDEYIERSELIRFVDNIEEDHMGSNTRIVLDMPGLRYLAKQLPSADVVPVVHCRDCVYNGLDSMPHTKDKCYRLMLTCFTVKPEDFCAWGRKKDGE